MTMQEIISWLNTNSGFASLLVASASAVVAVIAVIVSVCISKKQNKIALYEKRFECYQKIGALLNYAKFVAKFPSFECTEQVNPVWACQWEYLAIHDKPTNRKLRENLLCSEMKQVFASNCFSKDEAVFNSMQLLIRIKDGKKLDEALTALQAFINSLFFCTNLEELKKKQENFSEKMSEIECCQKKLANSLRMYRTAFQTVVKKLKKFWRERNETSKAG